MNLKILNLTTLLMINFLKKFIKHFFPKGGKGQALLYSRGNTLTKNKFLKSLGDLGFETLDTKW